MWSIYIYGSIFVVLIIGFVRWPNLLKPNRFPPGPVWLPFVGCYIQFTLAYRKHKYYHLVWDYFHKLYGPLVGIKLGCTNAIIVSGYEAVKQVLNNDVYEGRPDGIFFRLRSFYKRLGVVFVEGPFMHEQRKFCLNELRKLGLGKTQMNEYVMKEALELVKRIKLKCETESMEIHQLVDICTLNVLWTMIAGSGFKQDDEKVLKLLELVHNAFHLQDMSGGLLNQMPFLQWIAPEFSGFNKLQSTVGQIINFMKDIVNNNDENEEKNFISAFSKQIRKNDFKEGNTFTEEQLLVVLEDLFMAGSETTSSTILFIIYYLMLNPHIQEKIHIELSEVVGSDQIPNDDHRDRLIYVRATIMEVQRYSSPVPIAIPHRAMKDTDLMGYCIPKGTVLMPSIWSVHMDVDHWRDPFVFRPERFINENGEIVQDNYFFPFGIGRRKCLGEEVAKTSLFLFTSILLHHFKIEPGDDKSPIILDGMTLGLTPFKVKFIPRSPLHSD